MVLMELALYGIRNFIQLSRFSFKPGFNLIVGDNGSGKSTLHDSLLAVFSPISRVAIQHLRTRQSTSVCQAALTFKDNDDRIYRLIRDFGNLKSTLAQLDASNNFQIKEQEEEPITQFLLGLASGLPRPVVLGFFSIKSAWMPSSRPPTPIRSQETKASDPKAFSPSSQDTSKVALTREQKETRLAELRELIKQADKLSGMEDHLSDIQSKSAETTRRLRLIREKSESLAQIKQQGEYLEGIGKLPEDYQLTLETAEQQEEIKTEKLKELDENIESLKGELEAIPSEPFYQNLFFLAGAGLSLVAIVLVGALNLGGLFQNLFMVLLVGGLGLMGYGGKVDFGRMSRRKELGAKLRESERQRTRAESTFRKENNEYAELLKKTGCTDSTGLKEKITEYERFLNAVRDLEAERDQYLSGTSPEGLQKELDSLKKQIAEIETELKSAAILPSDLYMIQEETRILERELMESQRNNPDSLAQAIAPPSPGSTAQETFPAPTASGSELLSSQLLSAIRDPEVQKILTGNLSELNAQLNQSVQKMGMTEEMKLSSDMTPVLTSKKNTPIPWDQLSSGQRDAYFLIYHLSVIRTALDRYSLPLLLDNPLSFLDTDHQKTLLDLLSEMAQNRQILLFSSAPYSDREDHHLIRLH